LSFGEVAVGGSLDLTFKITNTGGGTLAGTVSESCLDFAVVGDASYSLAGGDTATITVRFLPASAGAKACTLDTGASQCADLPCSGTGVVVAPVCQVSPTSLNFSNIYIGHSWDKTFTITNTGGGTLSGSVSEPCNDYSIVSGGGDYGLTASQSVVVTVRFAPTSVGTKTCSIETGASCAVVACTGVGDLEPVCDLSLSELDFGTVFVGDYRDTTFTITNVGGGILVGEVYTTSEDFSVVGAYEFTLGAGQGATFTIRFAPTSAGLAECMVDMDSEFCTGITCTGMGETPPACEVDPEALDFGYVEVGGSADLAFTIRNTLGGTMSGTVTSPCAEFSVVGGAAYSLGQGESATFTVRFSPANLGVEVCAIETGSETCTDVSATGGGAPHGDYYVHGSSGSDTNLGTVQAPFKTVTYAVAAAGPDKTICVLPGTYDAALGETFPIWLQGGQALVGDVASKGAGAAPTTIFGSGDAVRAMSDGYRATLVVADGCSVAGFSITATNQYLGFGIYINGVSVSISDNTFGSATAHLYGGVVPFGDHASVITRNDFQTSSYGVYSISCSGGMVVESNLFQAVVSQPIDILGSSNNTIIRGNTIIGTGDCGIQVQSGTPLIEDNVFNHPGGYSNYGAIRYLGGVGNPKARGNTFTCALAVSIEYAGPDLGTAGDPGGNDFSGVTGAAVHHMGSSSVSAVGNTWASSPPDCGSDIVITGGGTVIWGAEVGESCP
jgi:parallel beta-helix repeat protein